MNRQYWPCLRAFISKSANKTLEFQARLLSCCWTFITLYGQLRRTKSHPYTAGFCQLSGISSRSRVPVAPCIRNNTAASTDAMTCKRHRRRSRRISGRAAMDSPVSATPAQSWDCQNAGDRGSTDRRQTSGCAPRVKTPMQVIRLKLRLATDPRSTMSSWDARPVGASPGRRDADVSAKPDAPSFQSRNKSEQPPGRDGGPRARRLSSQGCCHKCVSMPFKAQAWPAALMPQVAALRI